ARCIDREAIAVAKLDRGEPGVEPVLLGRGQAIGGRRDIEDIVGALDHRLVQRIKAGIVLRGERAPRRGRAARGEQRGGGSGGEGEEAWHDRRVLSCPAHQKLKPGGAAALVWVGATGPGRGAVAATAGGAATPGVAPAGVASLVAPMPGPTVRAGTEIGAGRCSPLRLSCSRPISTRSASSVLR